MKKIIKLCVTLLCVIFAFATFIACTPGTTYAINVAQAENGSVSVGKATAKEGASITVTAIPNEGYAVESILLNGEELSVENNKATFKMPASEVTVSATFAKEEGGIVSENIPTIRVFDIEAPAVRTPAYGSWAYEFADDALVITVWVKDAHPFPEEDGIKTYFGLVGYDRTLGENNLLVHLLANGTLKTYTVQNGEFVESSVQGVSGKVQQWAEKDSEEVVGYKFTLTVAYATLKVDKASAKGSVTMLPAHTNKNLDGYATKESLLDGDYQIEKPHTYPVLTDDSSYKENPLATLTGQLGSAQGMEMGTYWNTEADYFPEEASYADRKVLLNGHDNADNNLYFYQTYGAKQMYAEATFKVLKVYSNEKYGKFGLMLYNGASKTGLFYYADAYIGEQTASVDNIQGTELGYNHATNGYTTWNTIPDTAGSLNLTDKTVTLKMAYKNGKLYLYCGEQLVMVREYAIGAYAVLGIKSFGYGLEVTNYYATTDASDPKFIEHTPEDTARQVKYLFVGDNYMANWSGYKYLETEGGKANEGLANETAVTLKNKAESLIETYKPENIVVNAGMNDLYSGATVQTVYNRVKDLIDTYHTVFPNAKVHWVSVIPTPLRHTKMASVSELNNLVKELAKQDALLEYIDAEKAFTANGEPRGNMFASDGFTLNSEFGYPLWGKVIAESLGIARAQGTDMGDNEEGYAYSNGWVFEDGGKVAVNKGANEQVIWYKNMNYSADLFVEADIYSPENTGADAWPKAGLALRNDNITIFAYVDFADLSNGKTFMNIVYRPNRTGEINATGDWQWGNQGTGSYSYSMVEGFVTLGIAKLDNKVYMLCNGEIVATYEVPGVLAEDEFIVGALNFNRKMEVKNVYSITDRNQVASKLGVQVIPEVSLEGASVLGGSGEAHQPSNLTYTVSEYVKTLTVNGGNAYARIYLSKTGAYVVTVNGKEVKEQPAIQNKGERIYVHDINAYLTEGENKIAIVTADTSTKIKAKVVIGYAQNEEVFATDATWAKTNKEVTLEQKPTYYFLGSSVTFGSATNGISFVENVQKTLGYNVRKEAVSGTTLVDKDGSSYISRMKTLPTETAVNRLIVQLSTNDVTQNIEFGALSSSVNKEDFNTLTVIGAIEYIIAYAKETWNCEVVFYTNPRYNNNRYNALVNELYKVQEKWGIGILDFYNYADMEALDSVTLSSLMADDIHPNVAGYQWMGEIFSEYIQNELEKDVIRKTLV